MHLNFANLWERKQLLTWMSLAQQSYRIKAVPRAGKGAEWLCPFTVSELHVKYSFVMSRAIDWRHYLNMHRKNRLASSTRKTTKWGCCMAISVKLLFLSVSMSMINCLFMNSVCSSVGSYWLIWGKSDILKDNPASIFG